VKTNTHKKNLQINIISLYVKKCAFLGFFLTNYHHDVSPPFWENIFFFFSNLYFWFESFDVNGNNNNQSVCVCVYIFAVLHYFPLFFIESPLQQHQQTIFAIVNLINFNLIFFWPNWFHLNQLNLICFSLQENQFKSFYLAPTIKISPRWWKKSEWVFYHWNDKKI